MPWSRMTATVHVDHLKYAEKKMENERFIFAQFYKVMIDRFDKLKLIYSEK